MTPGERIRELRKARSLTMHQLAELVGITQARLAYIENGRSRLDGDMARMIALELGCDLSDIFGPEPSAFDFRDMLKGR